jgi:hypothetical protein
MQLPFSASLIALLVLTAAPVRSAGQAPAPQTLSPAARYKKALGDSQSYEKVNVEQLFELAAAAAKEVEGEIIKRDEAIAQGHAAALLATQMDGLVISTEEAPFARPDPRFFIGIAEKKGRPIDRTFFELLTKTRPDGAWPVYIEQQTDLTGCTRFENPDLVSIYRGWLEFRKHSPSSYRAQVTMELRLLEDQLLTSTCACGAQASVVEGLEKIVTAFPKATITPGIQKRLQEIRAGTSPLRFNCISG